MSAYPINQFDPIYCSTYCLNLNGAAVNNPRALFMLRHQPYLQKQKTKALFYLGEIALWFLLCLSMIRITVLTKMAAVDQPFILRQHCK